MQPYVESLTSKWMQKGNCATVNFIVLADTKHEKEQSKKVCQGCSVINECLEYALDNNEHGIWGGTTDKDRRHIKRRRNTDKA